MMALRKRTPAGRYHHGDLRAALIDTAVDLIAERGIRGFSLAEASRRLGVTAAAPYSHFADRDELLKAVALRATGALAAMLAADMAGSDTPTDRLAAASRGYVRFASVNRPLFEVLFGAGLDKRQHPELDEAAQPVAEAFLDPARALCADAAAAEILAFTAVIVAHGHAALLLDGAFGYGDDALDIALARSAATARAIVLGREALPNTNE
jgi:AcrR family transcriptional regulator